MDLETLSQNFRQLTLEQVQKTVDMAWSGEIENTKNSYWWSHLVERAIYRAYDRAHIPKGQVDLAWVFIAIKICQHLLARQQSHDISMDLAWIRTKVISILGDQPDNAVGTSQDIVRWFFNSLPLSLEEVKSRLPITKENIRQRETSELLMLRRIKQRMNVLKSLHEKKCLELTDELQTWFDLWSQLP